MPYAILIVEDEDTLRQSLARVLSKEGYEVDAVVSAEAALSLMWEKSFALVLTDVILPGMSGMTLLRKCLEMDPAPVVIITTAYATIESAVEAIRAGAFTYLVKPFTHEELSENIRQALGARPAGKG